MGELESSDAATGLRIGRYTVERTLGRGAMGVVYAARHDVTQQQVALKTLTLLGGGQDGLLSEERFLREIKAAISLQHPGIVRVMEFDRTEVPGLGPLLYYAMERIDGVTLHELLQRSTVAPEQAAAIGVQVCEALDFAHRRGVVHRDVKPANIFIDRARRVILTDFGICKIDGLGTLTAAGAVVGTMPFMAPEQAIERPVDARSDVFAVGAVLYTLLGRSYLRSPKIHQALRQATTPGDDERRVRERLTCTPALVEVVARAVAWEPERRHASAAELGQALRPFAGQIPAPWPDDELAAYAPTLEVTTDRIASPDSGSGAPAPLATAELFDRSAPWLNPPTEPGLDLPRPVSGLGLATVPGPGEDIFAELERAAGGAATPPAAIAATAEQPAAEPAASLPLYTPARPAPLPSPPTGATPLVLPDLRSTSTTRAAAGSELSGRRAVRGTRRQPAAGDSAAPVRATLRSPALRWALLVAVLVIATAFLLPWLLRGRPIALSVETMPPGAEVLIDGARVGITPLAYQHPHRRGALDIELRAAEREPYRTRLELPLRGVLPPLAVAMPLQRASLQVEAQPLGAHVLVDGMEVCRAPCTVPALAPRTPHIAVIAHEGCTPQAVLLRPEPDETLVERLALVPLTPS